MSALVKGKVVEVACNHAASRVIQFMLKHGTAEVRKMVVAECQAQLLTLAKHSYGHFVARKVVELTDKSNLQGEPILKRKGWGGGGRTEPVEVLARGVYTPFEVMKLARLNQLPLPGCPSCLCTWGPVPPVGSHIASP